MKSDSPGPASLGVAGKPTVTVHIPLQLSTSCGGAAEVDLLAASVRAVLDQLERKYPTLHRNICDETGKVRRHINVFVNSDNTRDLDAGVETVLAPGDVVTILPAVSGG